MTEHTRALARQWVSGWLGRPEEISAAITKQIQQDPAALLDAMEADRMLDKYGPPERISYRCLEHKHEWQAFNVTDGAAAVLISWRCGGCTKMTTTEAEVPSE